MRRGARGATACAAVGLVLFYAVLQTFVLPPEGFLTGDQGPKYLQASAFARQGLLSPDIPVLSRDIDLDLEFQDPILHRRGDRLVSAFSWLLPMLTAPFVRLLGVRGMYAIPALSVLVIFFAARNLGRKLGLGSGLWSAWTAVAATPMLFFGAELWEHAPAAACVMLAANWLAPASRPDDGGVSAGRLPRPSASARVRAEAGKLVGAGAACGLAALFREEAGLALPALLLARRGAGMMRVTALAFAGAAAMFLASVPLNLAIYGSPLPLHLSSEVEKTHSYLTTRAEAIRDMILPAPGAALFVVAIALAIGAILLTRKREAVVRVTTAHAAVGLVLAAMVAVPMWRLVTGVPAPFAGFTMSSAAHTWIVALALIYYAALPGNGSVRTGLAPYVLWGAVLLILGTLAIVPSAGGAQWSPRYIASAAPLLAVLAVAPLWTARALPGTLGRQVTLAVSAILALSLVVQLEGPAALRGAKRLNAGVAARTAEATAPGDVVITVVP